MTTWRALRKELVGAWRSVQYDLARVRPRRRADGEETTQLIFTEHARPPRRLVATGAFAMASLAGAAATYFAVVSGLGALLETDASAAESPKPVIAGAAGTGQRSAAEAEAGKKTTVRIARQGGPLTAAGRRAGTGGSDPSDTRGGVPGALGGAPGPRQQPGAPVPEDSPDPPGTPPTPAPTATPTTDPGGSPTATPDPGPTATATPDGDDQHDEGRRRHRHHRPDQDETP
ncbi:hypothetical protein AB0J74_36375 [Asanoa sp. NPDC049573]|uniref:hypothetical protein n=1 Tax=Asanoa sp. NPDC049573 TaxID=3155396 RepID=UPI003422D56D